MSYIYIKFDDAMPSIKGCDMRGFLSFQILWLLSKRDMHGEELAEEIKRRRGDKPKPGTLYPALKELTINGLIKGKKNGKIVKYSLTKDGDAAVKRAKAYFVKCFGELFQKY